MRLSEAYARTELAEVVSLEQLRELCPTAHVALKRPGEVIFAPGEPARAFTFLVTGRVKLVKRRADGHESILDFVDVGSAICPTRPHLSDCAYCCHAIADAHATRVLVIPRRDALELMRHVPEATQLFLSMLATRTARMCARTSELGAGRVQQRIATLLLRAAELGTREADRVRIELPLSRRDLAELCATTAESATRTMRELEDDGVVRTHAWGFEILDEAGLREIAEG